MGAMSYADGPMPMDSYEKRQMQRNKAMKERMGKLPQNPVVKKATSKLNKQINQSSNSDQWGPVDSLVSTAYSDFCDGTMSFKEATTHLGEAISALSSKQK